MDGMPIKTKCMRVNKKEVSQTLLEGRELISYTFTDTDGYAVTVEVIRVTKKVMNERLAIGQP